MVKALNKKQINIILRILLITAIPILLFLLQKKASADKGLKLALEEGARVVKPKLPYSNLEKRMTWLKTFVPQRIPKVMISIEDGKVPISIVVYKKEREVELWSRGKAYKKLKTYKMTSFSGKLGPKNQQWDNQIPEGIYRANALNPNSSYYLSIGVNYPNSNDRNRGREQGVKNLGDDIFIHGNKVTMGCVPIGDHYIEELFYVVGKVGLLNSRVVISPSRLPLPSLEELKLPYENTLLKEKYSKLTAELINYN